MRIIPTLDATDELTHLPDDDPTFQESALFAWHDLDAGIGGFWRIGQEVNAAKVNSSFGLFTADGLRFRSNVTGAQMTGSDRSGTHMAWGSALKLDLENQEIKADFPDCEVAIRFEDFFPRYDWFALTGQPPMPDHAGSHFEVAGRMSGKIRMGDREMDLNALAYRDRSWGPRTWTRQRCTRWWPCVFGPDLCAFSISTVLEPGIHGIHGFVVRDGVPLAMKEIDTTASLDYDGIGARAAHMRFTLENGETGEIFHERKDGIVASVREWTAIESIGVARWGDRIGMSDIEVSTNPSGGTKPPLLYLHANASEGLTRR